MATTLKYYFFELKPPKNLADPYTQLRTALTQVNKAFMVDGIPLRLESASDDGTMVVGTASKTDLHNLPVIINPGAPGTKNISLREEEGLGRPTGFLVTRRGSKILLVFQHNWNGLRVGGFAELLQLLVGSEEWSPLPILEPDKFNEVMSWGVVRHFKSRVANPSTKQEYRSKSIKALAEISDDSAAPAVSMSMSMGRARKGSLNVNTVRSAIMDLLGLEHGQIESLVVGGMKSDNEKVSSVDLLHHKLGADMLVPGETKTLTLSVLEGATLQAYNKTEQQLKKHFGS